MSSALGRTKSHFGQENVYFISSTKTNAVLPIISDVDFQWSSLITQSEGVLSISNDHLIDETVIPNSSKLRFCGKKLINWQKCWVSYNVANSTPYRSLQLQGNEHVFFILEHSYFFHLENPWWFSWVTMLKDKKVWTSHNSTKEEDNKLFWNVHEPL